MSEQILQRIKQKREFSFSENYKGNSHLWIVLERHNLVSCLSLCPWPFILVLWHINNIFWLKLPLINVTHLVLHIIIAFLLLNLPFQFQKERKDTWQNGSFSLKPRELDVIYSKGVILSISLSVISCAAAMKSSALLHQPLYYRGAE